MWWSENWPTCTNSVDGINLILSYSSRGQLPILFDSLLVHLGAGSYQLLFKECCQTYHKWSDSQNSQKRSDILSAGCNKDDRSLSLWALRVHFNTIVWVKTFLTWSNIVRSQKLPQPKDLVGRIFLDPCLRFVNKFWSLLSASTFVFLGCFGLTRKKKFWKFSFEKPLDRLRRDLKFSSLLGFDWLFDDFCSLNDLWVSLKPPLKGLIRSDNFRLSAICQKPWIFCVLHPLLWQSAATTVKNLKVIQMKGKTKTAGLVLFPDIKKQLLGASLVPSNPGSK